MNIRDLKIGSLVAIRSMSSDYEEYRVTLSEYRDDSSVICCRRVRLFMPDDCNTHTGIYLQLFPEENCYSEYYVRCNSIDNILVNQIEMLCKYTDDTGEFDDGTFAVLSNGGVDINVINLLFAVEDIFNTVNGSTLFIRHNAIVTSSYAKELLEKNAIRSEILNQLHDINTQISKVEKSFITEVFEKTFLSDGATSHEKDKL